MEALIKLWLSLFQKIENPPQTGFSSVANNNENLFVTGLL